MTDYTLGIHDGHNATSALLKNGEVVAAVSEGRMIREKHIAGHPENSINEVLDIAGIAPEDIDRVAINSLYTQRAEFFGNHEWYEASYKDQISDQFQDQEKKEEYFLTTRQNERCKAVTDQLGIRPDIVHFTDHHRGHAAKAYYGSPWNGTDEDVLVFTLDGAGDGLCATVSIANSDGIERISESETPASLGKIFSRTTYLLGMRPWEDEYKVMGMAPYVKQEHIDRVYPVFEPLVELDGMEFVPGTHLSMNYCYGYLKRNLEQTRFDWVCGALQQYLENMVTEWVSNAIEKTGIHKVAFGGGVFMNVKANMEIMKMDEVEDSFFFPSCGDGALGIGAAYHLYKFQTGKNPQPGGIETIYWGPEYSRNRIHNVVTDSEFEVHEPGDIHGAVAELLEEGHVVGNFNGRLEWGARALGNRSILANPSRKDTVREINKRIKMRDFWMPFAPSILDHCTEMYIKGVENPESRYMIRAFETTEQANDDLRAAMHEYDQTIRPHIVTREDNPDYYRILVEFFHRTGIGGVLNTSFNLHGEPIVRTPENTLHVLRNSGLEFVRLGPYLVEKE